MQPRTQQQPPQQGTVVRTNAFEINWPKGRNVYHYDVDIQPLFRLRDGEVWKLGHVKGTELMMRLQSQVDPQTFARLGAYDGKKNLFSFEKYNFESKTYDVLWNDRAQREPKKVSITITYATHVNFDILKNFVRGDLASVQKPDIALNMLNLFFQSTPRMSEPNVQKVHNSRSFFTSKEKASRNIGPLQLWRGYFQSVRPGNFRLLVNVDVTVGTVIPERNLEEICMEFLKLRNLRDLWKINKSDMAKLRLYLRGLKVTVMKKTKVIRDIVGNCAEITFEKKDGTIISVKNHFENAHRVSIMHGTLGVKLGNDGIFPMSVCATVQQLYKNKSGLSPNVVREALEFTPRDPGERLNKIRGAWDALGYQGSEFLRGAGVTVNPEPVQLTGRLLANPPIGFHGGEGVKFPRAGVWDIMGKKLRIGAQVSSWTVVDFSGGNPDRIQTFIKGLQNAMMERGMGIPPVSQVFRGNGYSYERTMAEASLGGAVRMIVVLLPESAGALYPNVKRMGDITMGVTTQCVKWSRKLEQDSGPGGRRGALDQYFNNLILKINVKLGGTNSVPFARVIGVLRGEPTMVVGADVSHPGPGSQLPSVASLVSSVDSEFLRYVASVRIQEKRTEMISDIAEMFQHALMAFCEHSGPKKVLPRRIIIFRDGVSEGEFATVKNEELQKINGLISDIYSARNMEKPSIVLLIVGKRHHFRFFPMREQDTDRRGNNNLQAGFVVDDLLKHPVYEDFYLQSQAGLKGTSRPSHYTVLENTDRGINTEMLKDAAYAFCHCYSRSTRSVKVPAPVYYADLVCRRAKFHFDEAFGYEDIDAQSAHSGDGSSLPHFKASFRQINERLKNGMYFV